MEPGIATLSLQEGYSHGLVLHSAAGGFLFCWVEGFGCRIWFKRNAELNGVGTHWNINKPRREGATEAACSLNIHNYRRTDQQGDFLKRNSFSRLLFGRHTVARCSLNSEVSHIP